ncbi:MAG: adenylyl-sulfate kinase [Deltaproteobacteria bacterium]|nr:adenylyl-sulfate kinase [Deltaproteobacteria bacterium]
MPSYFLASPKGWAAWFTGLPGSGKSKISKLVYDMLADEGITCIRIELDAIRKKYVNKPEYTDSERDFIYKKLVDLATENVQNGINVIIDATAHKRLYRDNARKKIKRFAEVMIKCPLSVCIERESKRKKGHIVLFRKCTFGLWKESKRAQSLKIWAR